MATYTVKKGDTLAAIAKKTGISLSALLKLNPQIKNPNLINPGQAITTSKVASTSSKAAPTGPNDAQNAARLIAEQKAMATPSPAVPVTATPLVPGTGTVTATGTATAVPADTEVFGKTVTLEEVPGDGAGNAPAISKTVKSRNPKYDATGKLLGYDIIYTDNTTGFEPGPSATPPVVTTTPPPASVTKVVGTFTDPKTGDVYALREDGSKELLSKGTKEADTLTAKEAADAKAKAEAYNAKMVEDAKTQEIKEKRESAYEVLKTEFTKYGFDDAFISQIKNLVLTGTPASEATLKLRGTEEYAARFAGNQERRNAGKNVYDEATYLSLENQYRETFGAYGLDGLLGNTKTMQAKLAQYIAQDKSPVEIKKRVQMAVEQVQNRTDVRLMFAEYYPEITDKDLVSYFLEPKDTLANLQNKVNIASIGSTAMRQGLVADINTSQALSEMGVSEEQAAAGYRNVAAVLPEAQKLTAIEGGKYTQAEAEGAYLKNLASEQRKIAKLAEREQARFTGSSGVNKASLAQTTKGQLY